ncbi:hypothetical protein RCL1_002121 [Eukaryota sp. TZLM3-RCL]
MVTTRSRSSSSSTTVVKPVETKPKRRSSRAKTAAVAEEESVQATNDTPTTPIINTSSAPEPVEEVPPTKAPSKRGRKPAAKKEASPIAEEAPQPVPEVLPPSISTVQPVESGPLETKTVKPEKKTSSRSTKKNVVAVSALEESVVASTKDVKAAEEFKEEVLEAAGSKRRCGRSASAATTSKCKRK